MARRGMKYKEDYISYWNSKGDYGKIRVSRMQLRKQKRNNKMMNKIYKYRFRRGFSCEMGYTSCELRGWCNGDC